MYMLTKFSHGLCSLKSEMGVWCLSIYDPMNQKGINSLQPTVNDSYKTQCGIP